MLLYGHPILHGPPPSIRTVRWTLSRWCAVLSPTHAALPWAHHPPMVEGSNSLWKDAQLRAPLLQSSCGTYAHTIVGDWNPYSLDLRYGTMWLCFALGLHMGMCYASFYNYLWFSQPFAGLFPQWDLMEVDDSIHRLVGCPPPHIWLFFFL